ncbi:MAG: alpha-2-macroglobulin [Myxococcota bacterium]
MTLTTIRRVLRHVLPACALLAACTPSGGSKQPGPSTPPPEDPNVVHVQWFTPNGLTQTVPIEVHFNQPVVPASAVGTEVSAKGLLDITPPVPGKLSWRDRDTLVLLPSEPLVTATRYTAEVHLTPPEGKRFGGEHTFHFNTELLGVVGVQSFVTGVGEAEAKVNVDFSLPVKPADVSTLVHFLTASGQTLSATLETKVPQKTMAFRIPHIDVSAGAVNLKVKVDGTLAPAGGGEALRQEVLMPVTITKPTALLVEQVYPAESSGKYVIYVRLNDDVDPDSVKNAISLDPPTKITVEPSGHLITLRGTFKPNTNVTVTIKKGLFGLNGGQLEEEISRVVLIQGLQPELKFSHGGSYLQRGGAQKFALESVNIKKLKVQVDKVLENNLVHVLPRLRTNARYCGDDGCYDDGEGYDGEYYGGDGYYGSSYSYYGDLATFGTNVLRGEVVPEEKPNEWVTTNLPFSDVNKDDRFGLYRLRVMDSDMQWRYAEKWLLATDLGISAKIGRDQARVLVVSLASSKPVAGVKVELRSSTNQLVGQGLTDASGAWVASLSNVRAGEPVSVITAAKDGDFSYLALASSALKTADFDVGGEGDSTAPYEAYVYLDRGIYRPGDTAKVSVLVRDKLLKTPPPFPYTVEIRNPQYRVFQTLKGSTEQDGISIFSVDFPADAPTGTYAVRVLGASGDGALGTEKIKLEEFMPDRLKVVVTPSAPKVEPGESIGFDIASNYLFGPPAKGLKMQAECAYDLAPVTSGQYAEFGLAGGGGKLNEGSDLGESALDDEGHASLACGWQVGDEPPQRPVRVSLYATVSENGGRAVTGLGSQLVHPLPYYLGARRNSSSYYASIGKSAELELLALDHEGKPKAGADVDVVINKVSWKSVLRLVNGRYQYTSEKSSTQIASLHLKSAAGPTPIAYSAADPGWYEAKLSSSGARAEVSFWAAGDGYAGWEMKDPTQIGLTMDKPLYGPGDTANVMVRAPFAGHLYLTVERDRVLFATDVVMTGNTTSIPIPLSAAMAPNAFVVATLLRPVGSAEKLAPMRAFGVAPFKVKADEHKLEVKLSAPETMRPNQPIEVSVEVQGGKGSVQATLAAVDEGILRITNFQSPDPFAFFTRRRRLGITSYDMFEDVLPEVEGRASAIVRAAGGDAERTKHLNPVSIKRVKAVALWSGLVKLDGSGKGKIKLDVPQFQGQLRLMAVAFEGDRFGGGQRQVIVRDPIVLTPTLPRFVGPLDRFQFPIDVFNGTGADAEIEVGVEIDGRIKVVGEAKQKIKVAKDAQESVHFELLADEVAGKAKVVVRARGGGQETSSDTELAIRPPNTVTTEGAFFVARPGEPVKYKFGGGYLAGTMKTRVTVGPAPVAGFGAALQYLISYPYGCVEQTTSKAFPLLYLKDLAKTAAPELANDKSIDIYVNAAIARLSSMLTPEGGLSYWPGGGYGYPWATIYGTHFLVEAKKAGYQVDDAVLKRLLDHLTQLSNQASFTLYGRSGWYFENSAYALYVLAAAGRPNSSATNFAAEAMRRILAGKGHPSGFDWVPTDEQSRALIAGALMLGGDRGRAEEFLGRDFSLNKAGPRYDMWSSTRADALLLSVLADVNPNHRSVPALMRSLSDEAKIGRWYNTQENAFALVALGKIQRAIGGSGAVSGVIKLGGKEIKTLDPNGPVSLQDDKAAWLGQELEVSLTGAAPAFVGIQVEGIRPTIPAPKSRGFSVERSYFDRQGHPINPDAITQGDVVVVRLELGTSLSTRQSNAVLVDLLPAGLEIENPRLSDQQLESWMTKNRYVPDYIDIRDDRAIMFIDVYPGAHQYYYYLARAVTEGEFVLPHVLVEAMYDPETQAYSGAGRLVVKGKR